MSALVDSSVWIDYFRSSDGAPDLDILIEENLIVTNDLVLTELLPLLDVRGERELIALLKEVRRASVAPDWDELVQMQITCLKNGINAVGIPDLMIAQNAIQNDLQLFTRDKHFRLLCEYLPLALYGG